MRRSRIRWLILAIAMAAALSFGPSTGVAQTSPLSPRSQIPVPPPLGAIVFFNSMQADDPQPLSSYESPSGLILLEYVGEGYIVKIRGKGSDDSSPRAALSPSYLNTRDGEIRVEAKVVSGLERAMIVLTVRGQSTREYTSSANAYWAFFWPGQRIAALARRLEGNDPPTSTLAMSDHQIPSMRPDDWNAYAVRLQGNRIWLLVNGEPVLYAEDMSLANRESLSNLIRSGDPDDRDETAAVFRNWQIAKLADE